MARKISLHWMTMTTMIKRFLFLGLLFYPIKNLFSQDHDAATWISAGFTTDIKKDFSFDATEELRYNISTADLYQLNTDLGLGYKFTKKIKIGIDYRYSVRREADVNRVGFSLNLREGFHDWDLSFRSRVQYSFIPDRKEGTSWRNKGTVKYEGIKDLTPYFSVEIFYGFSNEINQFDNYRLEAGVNWEISKHNDLNPFYLFDREFNVNDPQTLSVLGLSYVYKF